MRFDDWDIILFPTGRDSKVPFKEFKVACHVVPDLELAHIHGSVGLPVMTCFVPSIKAGLPFQISIHCWGTPEISHFTRTYSKHTDLVKFEARILVDGRLVASSTFDRDVNGPHLITSSFEFTKTGELEPLRFPHFRNELLYQNHWNPGDDLGRIKVIISEGFPRDSLTVPMERIKNIIAFSFQHAPLEILENNGIAWPNPSMWRRSLFTPSMPVPTYRPEDGVGAHAHSPRSKALVRKNKSQELPALGLTGGMFPAQSSNSFLGTQSFPLPYMPPRAAAGSGLSFSYPDPFTDHTAYLDWMNSMTCGQASDVLGMNSNTSPWPVNPRLTNKQSSDEDASMPDYTPPDSETMSMHISGPSLEDDPMSLKVPANTPIACPGDGPCDELQGARFPLTSQSSTNIPSDFATSLTHSLLNQPLPLPLPIQPQNIPLPASEIKSRKENRHLTNAGCGGSNPSSTQSTPQAAADQPDIRKFSQPLFGLGNLASGISMSLTSPEDASVHESPGNLQAVFPGSSDSHHASSTGDFGGSTLNTATPNPLRDSSNNSINMGGGGSLGLGNANSGNKRTRNFTPASAKAIDKEDEPRRANPHVRIAGYGEDAANEG
ncbi:hypothetical protein B0H66DRAFT_183337 [Apodospora peruviana]|uniref:Uncharacterized protein n=1 Tax=Apodospora peruviana TaxID=516989 RepID=A0AAE0IB81_9PEZI|nr:hypothetical protein B0H66DRAFT_183337 [Apodospora peruviana]